jgi:hypothetical protein
MLPRNFWKAAQLLFSFLLLCSGLVTAALAWLNHWTAGKTALIFLCILLGVTALFYTFSILFLHLLTLLAPAETLALWQAWEAAFTQVPPAGPPPPSPAPPPSPLQPEGPGLPAGVPEPGMGDCVP